MTNTLHRYGDAESFHDDYVVFAIACKGKNDQDALPKLRRFLEIALEYKPVNLGDARHGGALRPSRSLNPLSHWKRDMKPDFMAVINGLDVTTTCAASIDGAEQCCHHACLARHSVGYSLGFEGKTDKLPNSQVLMLSTMCGHGMISHSLSKKMIDWVKEGRRTPEQAVSYLARFCSCGVFNPSRAKRILEDARTKTR